MIRAIVVVAMAMALAGCGLARVGGQPEPGPEQFTFHVVPGGGTADDASRVAEEMASGPVTDASLIGTVATPLGQFQIVTYTETVDGFVMQCRALSGSNTASGSCQSPPTEPAPDEVTIQGVGLADGWATVDVVAGPEVVEVVGRAGDGTVYRSDLAEGYALLVYPTDRGGLTITGLDHAGEAVAPSVEVDDAQLVEPGG